MCLAWRACDPPRNTGLVITRCFLVYSATTSAWDRSESAHQASYSRYTLSSPQLFSTLSSPTMTYGVNMGRSLGYLFHGVLGCLKAGWYPAIIIMSYGVINEWWSASNLLVWFSGIDAGVDIIGIVLTLTWIGPANTVLADGESTWVSKWSLLKHTLSDQWHFTASLAMNVFFLIGFYPFWFANNPISSALMARFYGYHFLAIALASSKAIIIFFTGFTTIECDECGPYTVKPCVECAAPNKNSDVESGNDDNSASQVPMSAIPTQRRATPALFVARRS